MIVLFTITEVGLYFTYFLRVKFIYQNFYQKIDCALKVQYITDEKLKFMSIKNCALRMSKYKYKTLII